MAAFIKLTHLVSGRPKDVYVNVEQICRVGESVGAGAGYQTNILLANQQVDVCEPLGDVMELITSANAAVA